MRFNSNLALSALLLTITKVKAAPSSSPQDELWKRASGAVTTSVKTASNQSYDYIIVGAGLTGLTVANRLTEDPNISVLVIEAGKDTRNDEEVYSIAAYGEGRNDGVHDFAYKTETIPITGNTKTISAGKGLGGSTSINGGAVTGGDQLQFDDFGKLNSGWSFKDIQSYWKKAETFTPPNSAQKSSGATYDAASHGTNGPVNTAYTSIRSNSKRDYEDSPLEPRFYTGPYQKAFIQAAASAINLKSGNDLLSGHTNMVAMTPNTINVAAGGDGQTRVSSATAYLSPIENSRPNLRVLTTYTVTQINWDANTKGKAVGVQVKRTKDGNAYNIVAKREVLVAAGSIGTPMLLEASGVGDSAILKKIGVAQQISLPGVGKNLIEQTMNSVGASANLDTSGGGPSSCIAGAGIANLFPDNSTAVLDQLQSNLQSYADQAVAAGAAVNSAGLMKIYNLMTAQIKNGVAVSELFADTGYPDGYGIDIWTLTVFSRGYAHASSGSVFDPPALNPRYFSAEIDMQFQVASLRAGRKILQSDSVKSLTDNGETTPGFDKIPDGTQHGRYSRWQDWIVGKTSGGFASVAHPIGTCSMMAQQDGGVVDPNFKVYGSQGLRVIDASILPYQFSQHLSTALYASAEKAADIIKAAQ